MNSEDECQRERCYMGGYNNLEKIWVLNAEGMRQTGCSLLVERKLFADKLLTGPDRQYLKSSNPLQAKTNNTIKNLLHYHFAEKGLCDLILGYSQSSNIYMSNEEGDIFVYDDQFTLQDQIYTTYEDIESLRFSGDKLYIQCEEDLYSYNGVERINLSPYTKYYFYNNVIIRELRNTLEIVDNIKFKPLIEIRAVLKIIIGKYLYYTIANQLVTFNLETLEVIYNQDFEVDKFKHLFDTYNEDTNLWYEHVLIDDKIVNYSEIGLEIHDAVTLVIISSSKAKGVQLIVYHHKDIYYVKYEKAKKHRCLIKCNSDFSNPVELLRMASGKDFLWFNLTFLDNILLFTTRQKTYSFSMVSGVISNRHFGDNNYSIYNITT